MNLQVKPHTHNSYPLAGLLIKGSSPVQWLQQLQHLEVNLQELPVYALPGNTANSLWGCLVSWPQEKWKHRSLNATEPCQCVHGLLFIPQQSDIYPLLNVREAEKLFSGKLHFLHPEIGLVLLENPVNWSMVLSLQPAQEILVTVPAAPVFIPSKIQTAEILALPPEEAIQEMERNLFPTTEKLDHKPLSFLEKIKLGLLKALLGGGNGKREESGQGTRSSLRNMLEKWVDNIMPGNSKWIDKLGKNFNDLQDRNRTEMEKLMDLFKNNPDEALKYAIPLDDSGAGRGGDTGSFKLGLRWQSFDLFKNRPYGTGGRTVMAGDAYLKLQQQYRKTAADLIKESKHERAAFIYMKLLKDHNSAANALEQGKLYSEAASVYLKYAQNKNKAAECYEKGQMLSDAIGLYKELRLFEKAGDLYMQQHKQKEALSYYQMVADEHVGAGRYVKASLLMRKKMNNAGPAQELLLQGWRKDMDAFNCINNYFTNIEDPVQLLDAIEHIYKKEVDGSRKPVFLTALKYEYKKDGLVSARSKEIAYEIVAQLAKENPDIVSELRNFNNDKSLMKDVLRFKARNK